MFDDFLKHISRKNVGFLSIKKIISPQIRRFSNILWWNLLGISRNIYILCSISTPCYFQFQRFHFHINIFKPILKRNLREIFYQAVIFEQFSCLLRHDLIFRKDLIRRKKVILRSDFILPQRLDSSHLPPRSSTARTSACASATWRSRTPRAATAARSSSRCPSTRTRSVRSDVYSNSKLERIFLTSLLIFF